MPIRAHLPEANKFEPTAITAMSRAFEEVCSTLHVFAGDTIAVRALVELPINPFLLCRGEAEAYIWRA